MAEKESQSTVIDKGAFCVSAYQYECKRTNQFETFRITNSNMPDSRDVDFSLTENRLDYVLLHGFFVTSFVEKGVTTFLKGLSIVEKMFLIKKTKICTMSNGPGFDIVGYFCALQKCGLKLDDGSIEFNGLNSNQSWKQLFLWIITNAYPKFKYCKPLRHSFVVEDLFDINRMHELIGSLLFGFWDILLMVRVFQSTKASPEIVSTTMTEIFSKIKEETLIFYFGSKTNVQRVVQIASKLSSMCVRLNPVKIVLEENECSFLNVECKPKSQFIYFTVFQKKKALEAYANITSNKQTSSDQLDSKSCISDSSNPSSVSPSLSVSTSDLSLSSTKYELDSASLSAYVPNLKKSSNVDLSKANADDSTRVPACQNDLPTLQANESVNLGCVSKEVLEQIIQESIHKALENFFHSSGLKLCNSNHSEVDSSSLAKTVKVSTGNNLSDAHKPLNHLCQTSKSPLSNAQFDEYESRDKLSKLVQTSNLCLKNYSKAIKPDISECQMLNDMNDKTAKQLTSSSSSNCLDTNQANFLRYQSLNSLIDKCQNLIVAGTQLVSHINAQTEHSSMNRSCVHECTARQFHEINSCSNFSHPCCHFGHLFNDTFPCCSCKGLTNSNPCSRQSSRKVSSCPLETPCCRSNLDQKSCCQNLSCHNSDIQRDTHYDDTNQ